MTKETGGIILGPKCGNNCIFCYPIIELDQHKLRAEERTVLRNLIDFKKKGIKEIEISGADPIEYDNLVPLIKYIKNAGFDSIQLSTHGRRLADESFLKAFLSSGADRLRIPLYGSNAKIHDSITRAKGSFDETLKGIKGVLKNSNIHVQISSMIVKQNLNDLINLVDLVNGLGITDFYFSALCIKNKDFSYYVPIKDLSPCLTKAYDYSLKNNLKTRFMEIPYCAFGKVSGLIDNSCLPPDMGKDCPFPTEKNEVKDLPTYRLKKKVDMCNVCKCSDFCDGFFVNDVDKFGVGNLKPITK